VTLEFFDWLDGQPRTPTGVLATMPNGETRNLRVRSVFAEWRARNPPQRSFPQRERRTNQLALLGYLLDKEERL
jgi:hypothetical protein